MGRIDYSIIGKQFGRLTVIDFYDITDYGATRWVCECSCPDRNRVIVNRGHLTNHHTTSCGCQHRDSARSLMTRHGLYHHPLNKIWDGIKQRCLNENSQAFNNYGGRGIQLCDEWRDFKSFYNWAIDNGYESGLTIERKNNNGDYCPENCKWSDRTEQANNTRKNRFITYNNKTQTIAQWAKELGVSYNRLYRHLSKNNYIDFERYFGN